MSKKIYFEHPELPFEEWNNPYDNAAEPETTYAAPRPLYFCSFGSGSSGNSCYVGSAEGGLIVDVGIRAEDLEKGLDANGVQMKHVKGVLLTHDHSDHVKYVYALLRNHRHLKLFCTNRVLNGMLRKHAISKRIKEYHVPVFKEIPFKILDFEITAFEVPHDGSDNMGFSIEFDSRRFVVATDLGEVTDRARYYMSRATYLMIESNYDAAMLRMGRYPEYLKARIASGTGHLDNCQTAAFLKEIINPGLNHIFLCHLSKDNNTPQIALRTVREALESKGIKVGNAMETVEDRKADVQLAALPRFDMTRWFVFRK
ncbi:MAG: MBL fold metallo-hydrolase [Muribaculaceae bacterium]|nr:MBL fold metallo-hydrolase [Muribaculaceae bacterium]MDE6552056.1 MBL fold metallo-hydrolase [Muribaculaceae bacterium]